jgi:hypothetical protein
MIKCGICGKEFKNITHTHLKMHNMSVNKYLSTFPQTRLSWNQGLTKKDDSRVKGGLKKGQTKGHPCYYSKEYLGEERFNKIEEKRRLKIGKTVVEKGICKLGATACHEKRRTLPNYGFTKEGLENNKNNGFKSGHIPWTTGLTKYTDRRLKTVSDKLRKYPEGIDFSLFGWTKELRQKIRNRDNWHCKKCNASQKEFKSVLVVHHIDGNKCNNLENNLVTLCRKCHKDTHIEQDYKTGKFKIRKELLKIQI